MSESHKYKIFIQFIQQSTQEHTCGLYVLGKEWVAICTGYELKGALQLFFRTENTWNESGASRRIFPYNFFIGLCNTNTDIKCLLLPFLPDMNFLS